MKERFSFWLLVTASLFHRMVSAGHALTSESLSLPTAFKPLNYHLTITANEENVRLFYSGFVRITVKCSLEEKHIVLNTKDLIIIESEVTVKSLSDIAKPVIPILNHAYDETKEQYIITLMEDLESDKTYEINIPFEKQISPDSRDQSVFFRETYQVPGQKDRYFAFTKFGLTNARRLFPCFDQINWKAVFRVFLQHSHDIKGFSNTRLIGTEPISNKENWVTDAFEATIPMPTYMVAFAFGNIKSKEFDGRSSKEHFRIWTYEDIMDQMDYANEAADRIFQFFQNYFSFLPALTKLDLISLPNVDHKDTEKFYGLIILGDLSLVNSNPSNEILTKNNIAKNLCYALSQLWIGTQKTMFRWNEYWMNEALTLLFAEPCIDKVFNIFDTSVVDSFIDVLKGDAEMSASPVFIPENDFELAPEFANHLRYKKAYHLFRMINFILGNTIFQKAVTDYLVDKNFEDNSYMNKFVNVLSRIARVEKVDFHGTSLTDIIESWFSKKGYPLITIEREYTNTSITFQQKPFTLLGDPAISNDKKKGKLCIFPLSYTTTRKIEFENVPNQINWMKSDIFISDVISTAKYSGILFNVNLYVLCRVNYNTKNWLILANFLTDAQTYSSIHVTARVRLVSDMFALSEISKIQYTIPMNAIRYLTHEESYYPWMVAMDELNKIRINLHGTNVFKLYETFVGDILYRVFAREKFQKIDDLPSAGSEEEQLKKLIFSSSCKYGVNNCVQQCKHLFNKWFTSDNPAENNPIPQNLRGIVYCQAIKYGGVEESVFLWNQYHKQNDQSAVNDILGGLTCSTNSETLEKYLKWSIDGNEILPVHRLIVFGGVASNEIGSSLAIKFFLNHSVEIFKNQAKSSSTSALYLVKSLEVTTKQDDLDQLELIMNSVINELEESKSILNESFRKARRNVLWLKNHIKYFSELINSYKPILREV